MTRPGAYGDALADAFHMEAAPAFLSRTLTQTEIAVTQIHCTVSDNGLTNPIPAEEALLLTVQLMECPRHDLWIDGKAYRTQHLSPGAVSFYDLRRDPIVNSVSAFRNLHFYLPLKALNAIASAEGGAPVTEIPFNPGIGLTDPVLSGLAFSLLPAFERPAEANRLFVDHITSAAAAYSTQLLTGAIVPDADNKPAALDPRQCRQAQELMDASLHGELSLAQLSAACQMTPREFRAGFHRSLGMAPYRWLLRRRVEQACSLMRRRGLPLAEVARLSGFASERHLRRVFRSLTGHILEDWQRSLN